jgi:uncharacterized membrane protein
MDSAETSRQPSRRSGQASAGLGLGLLAFGALVGGIVYLVAGNPTKISARVLFTAILLTGLVAVVTGHRAKASIRRSGGQLVGNWMAILGLVFGYLTVVLMLSLIAIGLLGRFFIRDSRMAANQSAAVGSLLRINTAAEIYAEAYGGYPPTLAALGPAKTGNSKACADANDNTTCLLDENLASGRKSNYVFTYVAGPTDAAGKIHSYAVYANPTDTEVASQVFYFTDQTCVIRFEKGKEANPQSPPFGRQGESANRKE